MRMSNKVVPYKGQNYSHLKSHHLQEGSLFTDVTFPAIDNIIGAEGIPDNVVWKRASELTTLPRLFTELDTSKIVRAGELSCNWIVSACAILADVKEIRNKVIPEYWDQEWRENNYCGLFHFKFWRFGNWTDVVIDDFLPTVENVLLTTQSNLENEFWASLVEKAYAKLHGSYEALKEGELSDALVDFTGGVCEVIDLAAGRYDDLEEKRAQLYDMLNKESTDHSIVCFTAPSNSNIGERTELGLTKGHTYHMTDIKKVYLGETTLRSLFKGREKVAMVRLKDPRYEEKRAPSSPDSALSSDGNPFAYSTEVLARLRSKNTDWQHIDSAERKRLGLVFRDSTEFWMPLEDVVSEFSEAIICRLVTENFFVTPAKKWKCYYFPGVWGTGPRNTKLDRSGGGDFYGENFLHNPQFGLDIEGSKEIIIQLLQFQEDEPSVTNTIVNQLIGFHLVKVENNRFTRLHKLWPHNPLIIAEDHKRKREIVYRGHLSDAKYVIIPTTYREGDSASFLLRVFTQDSGVSLKELKEDIPKRWAPCSCLMPEVEIVTVIIIESAELENKHHSWGSARLNLYCTITCEGYKVKTDFATDDIHPEWNDAFIFYRKKPKKPLVLKVFSKNMIFPNALLGECELPAEVTHSPTQLDATIFLKQKTKEGTETVPSGTLHLTMLTEDNLFAV
ncbi:calpain-5-like isoform X2 [Cimex lectularius]|uniref:Calpain-5 n=1 Tax=Cimex lectularius TaxID=79782 RepID=A0A8I6RX58_CIMLE|nr:calpain-5-like isoform X2 [Cimex lectularius]